MSLLPDPDALIAVAERIARHADALRHHAQLLAAAVGHTTWHGPASRSFAHEALEVCTSLRRSAERLDAAAGTLRQHAARVRTVLNDLARAASDAAGVGRDTDRMLTDLVHHPDHLGRDGRRLVGGVVHVGEDLAHGAGHLLSVGI